MLGLKLIHVSKGPPGYHTLIVDVLQSRIVTSMCVAMCAGTGQDITSHFVS